MSEESTTPEFLSPEATIEKLTNDLAEAKSEVERIRSNRDFYANRADNYSRSVDRAKEYIFEQIKSGDLDADDEVVTSLAEIFDWELETQVDATVTATFRVTLTVPIGKSADDLDGELTADLTLDWERSREGFDLSIDDTEVELELD
jgi:sugar-specific transcriptional regulator TrmB